MVPHVLIATLPFAAAYSDLDLVAREAGKDEGALRKRCLEVMAHLGRGELDQLDIREAARDPGRKRCAVADQIFLVFEIDTEHAGSGAPIRHRVLLLSIETG